MLAQERTGIVIWTKLRATWDLILNAFSNELGHETEGPATAS